jgi:uncharacterized protein YegP (UPF0339 family)
MRPEFTITRMSGGRCRFVLKSGNGQVLLHGLTTYSSVDACLNGIESVRNNGSDCKNYVILESLKKKPFFVLKSGNGRPIGYGNNYSSLKACRNGMSKLPDILSVIVAVGYQADSNRAGGCQYALISLWERLKDEAANFLFAFAIERGRVFGL